MYEGIPHLLAPVVTDMKMAPNALNWCVGEMERRYRLMSQLGVRNLAGYNAKIAEAKKAGKPLTKPLSLTPDQPEPLEEMPLHRGGGRRARRPHDGARQEDRGAHRAHRAEGARRRHPPDPRDPAAVGRRDHRPHQGQHPVAHRVPGGEQDRLAHDPRPDGRGGAAGAGRHAVPAAGHRLSAARPRRVRVRRRGAPRGRAPEGAGRAAIHRGPARRRRRRRRRCRRRVRSRAAMPKPTMYDQAVDVVLEDATAVDLAGAAAAAHRLQPRRAARSSRWRARASCRRCRPTATARCWSRPARPTHDGPSGVGGPPRWRHASPSRRWAGPVDVYLTGPQFCPQDVRPARSASSEAQAIARTKTMLPEGLLRAERVRVRLHVRRRERIRLVACLCPPVQGRRRAQGQGRPRAHLPHTGRRGQLPRATSRAPNSER